MSSPERGKNHIVTNAALQKVESRHKCNQLSIPAAHHSRKPKGNYDKGIEYFTQSYGGRVQIDLMVNSIHI